MEYLEDLVRQIKSVGAKDTDSLLIIANEGEPAFVQVRSGAMIKTYKQGVSLDCLIAVDATNLSEG